MAQAKLTKAMVEHPEVPEQGHLVTWDTSPGMGGFGIRVSATGRVSYLVRYWTGSRERWKTLGAHPRMNLTAAKGKARGILRAAGNGADPVADERRAEVEQQASDAKTVEVLAADWLEALPNHVTRRGRRISPRTVEMYASCMKLYIVPELGRRPVSEVTRRDVAALLATATKRGGPYTGNRTVSVLSIFYGHLDRIEAVPAGFNPARKAPRNPEQRRGEHASVRLSRDQESRLVRAIYALIDGTTGATSSYGGARKAHRGRKHADPVGGVALLALLDTGRRLREILGIEWRRLDLEAGTVDLGATKGKAAGDVCYLTPRVREAIRRLPRIVGNPYVFHGGGPGGRRMGLQSAWEIAKAEAGLEEITADLKGFHLHDLRHHRISELLAAGVAPQLVARQVGHTSLEQLRTYSHLEVADVAAVLGKLEVVGPAPPVEVVEIAARA
jgi:integrase